MDDLKKRMKRIKMLLMDVDGVMTDGGIVLGPGSMEIKRFDVQDGMGITLARAAGLLVGILTGRDSEAVRKRAKELRIDEVAQGFFHKEEGYRAILRKRGLKDEEVAYIGDDVLDIPILERVGLSICVANGTRDAKKAARYITKRRGGDGAVREVVEMLLEGMGKKKAGLASILNRSKEGKK
jgi:3-deoxy-D-manno-octulosonate 8-phosphate phosphatase (KDO 8-P phosphatase)